MSAIEENSVSAEIVVIDSADQGIYKTLVDLITTYPDLVKVDVDIVQVTDLQAVQCKRKEPGIKICFINLDYI